MMRTAIRKLENLAGIIIPKRLLTEIGVEIGDSVDVVVQAGRLVLTPVERRLRAGWAEASQRVAEDEEPFACFAEWACEADRKGYAGL